MTNNITDYQKNISELHKYIFSTLKYYRKSSNFSQNDIAKVIKVSYQQYQKYESGKDRLPAIYLHLILEKLQISYEKFFGTEVNNITNVYLKQPHLIENFTSLGAREKEIITGMMKILSNKNSSNL
ncbi:MAG: helix-turn-helix domain-containing protein [Alphaproteobacteria bacterium]